MITIHKNECKSTQNALIEHCRDIKQFEEILFYTDKQTSGIGRSHNSWHHFPHSFACSFTLRPSDVLTLTSLEIGILIHKFLKEHFNEETSLKWPNDIFNCDKKMGGIIIYNNTDFLICGVGLNFKAQASADFDYSSLDHEVNEKLYQDFYQYVLDNRMKPLEIITSWNKLCFHLNQKVLVDNKYEGIFKGIGENGEALIQKGSELIKEYSASLIIPG